jgi:hypothetical protein
VSDFFAWVFYIVTFTAALIVVLGVIALGIAEYFGWRDEKRDKEDIDLLREEREWERGL